MSYMSTTGTDLHSLAVETDTRLADLHRQAAAIRQTIASNATTIKQYGGAKRTRHGYTMTLTEAEAIIDAEGFEPANPVRSWGYPGGTIDEARSTISEARIRLAEVDAQIVECNAIWLDNDCWSRFFLVPAGHLHRDMHCATCNRGHEPTTFGWLPQLSGLTEADAVAAHGALLCTTCYPSAPVAWTNGNPTAKPGQCAGSRTGDYPRDTARTGYHSGNYGVCSHCGQRITLTNTGRMRAHQAEPPAPKKRASRKPAAPAPVPANPEWDTMQSPELDDALRAFHTLDVDLDTTEGPAFEAAKTAYRAMQALAPAGWNSYRRANELGLNHR